MAKTSKGRAQGRQRDPGGPRAWCAALLGGLLWLSSPSLAPALAQGPPPWAPPEEGRSMLPGGPLRRFDSWVGRPMPGFWRAWGTEAHRSAFPGHWESFPWGAHHRWALMRAEGVGAAYLLDAQERVVGERLFEPIQLTSPRKAVASWLRSGLKGGPSHWASPSGHLSADALTYEGRFGPELVRRVALRVPSHPNRFPPQEELWLVEASQGPAQSLALVAGLEQEARSHILELAMRPPLPSPGRWE